MRGQSQTRLHTTGGGDPITLLASLIWQRLIRSKYTDSSEVATWNIEGTGVNSKGDVTGCGVELRGCRLEQVHVGFTFVNLLVPCSCLS